MLGPKQYLDSASLSTERTRNEGMPPYSRTVNRGQTTNGQNSGTYRNGQSGQSPFQISQQNGGESSSMSSPYSIASTGFQNGQSQNSGGSSGVSNRPQFNTAHTAQNQYAAGNGMAGRPVSPYSVAQHGPSPYGGGGSGDGRPVSPFSAAQNQHSGMQTPGQMFSSVLRPGRIRLCMRMIFNLQKVLIFVSSSY